MNIFGVDIITWMTKKAYLASYAEDEAAKKVATKLWNDIVGHELFLLLAMAFWAILFCWLYYFPFNKMPGRHYHPKWWGIFGALTLVVVFAMTIGIIAKNMGFDCGIVFRAAGINTLYAAVVYFLFSVFINRTGKSNAYPFPF